VKRSNATKKAAKAAKTASDGYSVSQDAILLEDTPV
jgi:hypothetical protein